PAGSGKTTTIYALLRHIAETSRGLSIISLEDPVERDLPGVTQIEVTPFGELTYERALRSILRQDPQVLMLGEIRDAATATFATPFSPAPTERRSNVPSPGRKGIARCEKSLKIW